ncbi:AraC family transcriptional regulator [Nocardia fluminea]|uniref:AraC family transcriptional regulator n=1 Tax=Nocardia fluminea TaxID=134984 RepID=UPI003658569A
MVLTEFAAEFGLSAEQCLTGTGIEPQQLTDPNVEVTARHDLVVSRNLVVLLGDRIPNLGLEVGLRYQLAAHGIWGFAIASSSTPRAAIDVGLRFVDLTFSLGRIQVREEAPCELQLVLDAPDAPVGMRRFFVERDAAAIRTMQRELMPDPLTPRRIEFAFPSPEEGLGRHLEIFGAIPKFDAPETILAVDIEAMNLPLPQSNPHTTTLAAELCRNLLEQRRTRTGVSGLVRDELGANLADPPGAEQVAATLHLSGRTLRKRLAAEGTSFRGLLDEVREHVAEQLLITAGLPVTQIAHRLGYVEVSSFSQAFRRWKGIGPREFRSIHRAQPISHS